MIPVTRIKIWHVYEGRLLTQQVNNPHGLHFPGDCETRKKLMYQGRAALGMRLKREVKVTTTQQKTIAGERTEERKRLVKEATSIHPQNTRQRK